MPVTLAKLAECYAVTAVMTLLLLAVGNLESVYYPRPVNPGHSWRSAAAGRFQAFLMLLYPMVSIPVVLAYLARYAFESAMGFRGCARRGSRDRGDCLCGGARLGGRSGGDATRASVDGAQRRRGPAYRLAICGAGNFARGRAFSAPQSRLKSGCGQYWPPYALSFQGFRKWRERI